LVPHFFEIITKFQLWRATTKSGFCLFFKLNEKKKKRNPLPISCS